MTTLKPCPFCGRTPDPRDPDYLYRNRHWSTGRTISWCIACQEESGGCGARITAKTKSAAILKWNTRPEEDRLRAKIEEMEGKVYIPIPAELRRGSD